MTVVRVSGETVRLGIEAPSDLVVLREELEQRPTAGVAEAASDETSLGADLPMSAVA